MRDTIFTVTPENLLVTYQKLPVKPHQITCLTPKLPAIQATHPKLLATRPTLLVTFSKKILLVTRSKLLVTPRKLPVTRWPHRQSQRQQQQRGTISNNVTWHQPAWKIPSHRQVTQGPQSPHSGPEQQNARTSHPKQRWSIHISESLCQMF